MARPTSTSGVPPPSSVAGKEGCSSMASKASSPPRQRRPLSTQQAPYTSTAQAAPSSRQQARPTPAPTTAHHPPHHHSAATATPAKRNDRERSTTDKDKEKDDPKMIGPWRIGRTIGKGSSGRVKIAKHSQTGQYAAVKIVPKHALMSSRMSISEAGAKADKALLGIEREIVIMKLIEHPNVMRLYDVWETGSDLYLILEYVEGGELFDYLVSKGRLHADEALHYFQQIIAGVDYCHRFNICHRDLKPENLLLDKERNIKIADFGMAALERNDKLLETSCGSPHYASPEIVAGLTYHGSSSDIWSCGIILFALLTGRLPFDDDNIRTLLAKVKVGKFTMPAELPSDAKDLIRRMLEVNPARRITMDQIRVHPWFTRRTPRQLPHYSEPPTPDQIKRPVEDVDEIDADILTNLKTLWNGSSEDEIIDALISKEKTWEKVFYCLLLKYRTRHLENFEEEEAKSVRKPSSSRARKEQPPPGPTRSKRSQQSLSDIASGAVEIPPTRPKLASPPRHTASTYRPGAAPPAASVRGPDGMGSPRRGPLPQTPGPTGMYSPSSKGPTPKAAEVPAIQLQEATPQSADRPRDSTLLSPTMVPPPSPTPSAMSSIPPLSPKLPIEIPQVDSPAMQRFFHDVVDQLQAMALRPLSPTLEQSPIFAPATPALPSPAIAGADRMSFTPVIRARDQFRTQRPATDVSQFADADEDASQGPTADKTSSHQAHSTDVPLSLQQQLQGMYADKQGRGNGEPMVRPLSIRKPPSPNASPLQPRRSVRQSPNPAMPPPRPPILRPTSAFATPVAPRIVPNRRGASSMIHTSPPVNMPGAYWESPPDKENHAPLKSALASGSTNADKKRVTLGLGIAGAPQQMQFSAFEPSVPAQGGASKLVKRKSKHMSTPSPMFSSPTPAVEAASAPKGSWFTNLFSWKTSVNYVLLSTEDVHSTRMHCKSILEAIGATVFIENADGAGVLKCRIDAIKETNGIITPVRASKFRVEFTMQTAASPVSPSLSPNDRRGQFGTCLTLIMEKGAQATFKAAYTRMRAEWQLDTPKPANSPRFRTTSNESGHSSQSAGSAALGIDGFRLLPTPSPNMNLEGRAYFQ